MKKLLIAAMMLFAFTMTFAQNNENTFKKNEISVAPYTANFYYYNLNQTGWEKHSNANLLATNYRRYLNENTALRFGLGIGARSFGDEFSITNVNVRAGFEKYLTLSPKFQLYGGAQLNLTTSRFFDESFRDHDIGVDLLGGVRYNINDKWSLSSEVIVPAKYYWSSSSNVNGWETGVKWQPLKLNFRF